ncbi:NUDIX domain-containing protein [Pseudonocardia eucalypti]|uniref:8-oxo-dGTP diphosphatase n=1 Tax=Pseudonocardia eucalypti TaxID=648755 RepID=A0ABP9PPU9_9PSEU
MGSAVSSEDVVVVGAAIVREGRLLAQLRSEPPEVAGRWELPGGRVEPGESEPAALRRECAEELGALVRVTHRIGPDLPLHAGYLLRVYAAALLADSPEPRPVEHAALRWVSAPELPGLDWLDADRVLLPDLADLLTG